jgi:hypothetical protein
MAVCTSAVTLAEAISIEARAMPLVMSTISGHLLCTSVKVSAFVVIFYKGFQGA